MTYDVMRPAEIRAARDAIGLTRKLMAAEVGINFETLQNWETGKTTPSPASYWKFVEALKRLHAPTNAHDAREPDRWRSIRERAGLTLQQMGYVMGVPTETIAEWERPVVVPTVPQRARYDEMETQLGETVG